MKNDWLNRNLRAIVILATLFLVSVFFVRVTISGVTPDEAIVAMLSSAFTLALKEGLEKRR